MSNIQVYDHFIDEVLNFHSDKFSLESFAYNVFGYKFGDNQFMISEYGQKENDKEFEKIVDLFNQIKANLQNEGWHIKSNDLEVEVTIATE